jgi:hypothetical protein
VQPFNLDVKRWSAAIRSVPVIALCPLEMQAAQHFYASFCSSISNPVRNPYNIECIIDGKLNVLILGCAKGQLARPLQCP